MNSFKQFSFFAVLLCFATALNAQVKVGSNPTTIAATNNLEVEATNGSMVFVTKANGYLHIGGRVGIGTTTPSFPLEVVGSSKISGSLITPVLDLGNGNPTNGGQIQFKDGTYTGVTMKNVTNNLIVTNMDDNSSVLFDFTGGGTRRFNITNADVGIGTTTPAFKFEVVGNSKISGGLVTPAINLGLDNPTNGGQIQFKDGTYVGVTMTSDDANLTITNGDNNGSVLFDFTGGGTKRFNITNARVGIGTTTSSFPLEVVGTSKITGSLITPVLDLGNGNPTNGGQIQFKDGSYTGATIKNVTNSLIITNADNNGSVLFDFTAGGTRRFNINNADVGIGTTSPTSKLQVVGLPVHAGNAAALAAGLTAGAFYHAGDGIVRVVF